MAISNLDAEKKKYIELLEQFNIKVLQVPDLNEIQKKTTNIETLKPILIEDLLGRKKVIPDYSLLHNSVLNKNICITGSGGSIGGELSKQIIKLQPRKFF